MRSRNQVQAKAFLDGLLSTIPDVTCHTMFGPAYFIDRKMFARVYGDGVAMKLPASIADNLLSARRASPFQPYDKAPMRG